MATLFIVAMDGIYKVMIKLEVVEVIHESGE